MDYIRTQADFPCMNPEDIFLIAIVFQINAEKHLKMKIAYEKTCDFLIALVCDFGKIDVEVYPIQARKFNFPDFESAPSFTKGYQEMSLSATNFLELGVIFKKSNSDVKYFIPVTSMHRLTRKQLEVTFALVQRSKKHNR